MVANRASGASFPDSLMTATAVEISWRVSGSSGCGDDGACAAGPAEGFATRIRATIARTAKSSKNLTARCWGWASSIDCFSLLLQQYGATLSKDRNQMTGESFSLWE